MPLPLAVPVGLLLGMTLAWIARAELARSELPVLLARPFLVTLGFAAFVFAPVVGYFVAFHGDWSWLYLFRSDRVPSAMDLACVMAAGAMVLAGFVGATPWAIGRRTAALQRTAAALVAITAITVAAAAARLGTSASYAQYHGSFGAVPLGKSSLGRGVLLSWVALAAGYAWSAWVLRRR